MTIRATDLSRVIRFLHQYGKAQSADAFSRAMLLELGTLIPADLVEYFELRQRDHRDLAYSTSRDVEQVPGIDDAFVRHPNQNPLGAFRWTPDDGALRLSSIVSARALRRLELYESYWGAMHITDQLKVWLSRSAETAVCVVFERWDGSFNDGDAAILGVLQPHLAAMHAARSAAAWSEGQDSSLTLREAQVLTCVASGRPNGEIAELLYMSLATVRKHLQHAYAKLGVHSRSEAIASLMRLDPMIDRDDEDQRLSP